MGRHQASPLQSADCNAASQLLLQLRKLRQPSAMHKALTLAAHRIIDSVDVGQLLPQVFHQVMEVVQQNAALLLLLLLHSPTLTWHRASTGGNGCSLQLAVTARSGLPCRFCVCNWCCLGGQQVLAPLGTVSCLHGGQVNGLVPLQDLQEGAI